MNSDERYEMNEEARITVSYDCECCGATIDGFNAIDPFEIDGKIFCLWCASDLTTLRFDGYIKQSDKTKELVRVHNRETYYRIYDAINFGKL